MQAFELKRWLRTEMRKKKSAEDRASDAETYRRALREIYRGKK